MCVEGVGSADRSFRVSGTTRWLTDHLRLTRHQGRPVLLTSTVSPALVIGLCILYVIDLYMFHDGFVLALGLCILCVMFCACIWLVLAVFLFCACGVWLFLLVLLLLLLHLMLARACPCVGSLRAFGEVRSSGWYHTTGLHHAFPGCNSSLEWILGG